VYFLHLYKNTYELPGSLPQIKLKKRENEKNDELPYLAFLKFEKTPKNVLVRCIKRGLKTPNYLIIKLKRFDSDIRGGAKRFTAM
jgi:hypothetical protein